MPDPYLALTELTKIFGEMATLPFNEALSKSGVAEKIKQQSPIIVCTIATQKPLTAIFSPEIDPTLKEFYKGRLLSLDHWNSNALTTKSSGKSVSGWLQTRRQKLRASPAYSVRDDKGQILFDALPLISITPKVIDVLRNYHQEQMKNERLS